MNTATQAILNEFLVESFENLSNINEELTQFEKKADDDELLNSIYRKVHTIKGASSFLGLDKLEGITHAAETLLDNLREKTIKAHESLFDVLLETFDICIEILKNIESTGQEGDGVYSDLTGKLAAELEKGLLDQKIIEEDSIEKSPVLNKDDVKYDDEDDVKKSVIENKIEDNIINEKSNVLDVKKMSANNEKASPSINKVPAKNGNDNVTTSKSSTITDSTIRVNVGLLDKMMNVVGELVLNRNQILQFSKENEDAELTRLSQQLNTITTELQTDIMTTRMQPVGVVFNKFERIIRDLAKNQGKKIKLEIVGGNTELDKTLLEMIKDPMTHLIRNAADHGIETPDKRVAVGKPKEGKLSIKAYHEGGQVIVEISDDGNGISPTKILDKAILKGLITPEDAERLSGTKILQFIFSPGFSTAEQVTNISGRGVGMDVVRSNIEKIGGKVEVSSIEGRGTIFKLRIPLTLAIVPALVVYGGGQTFALAQKNLVELVLLEGDKENKIENLHGHEFFRLRGELIPIFRLSSTLGFEEKDKTADFVNIVVMKAEGKIYGLVVDEIFDTQEIVVKPLGQRLKDQAVYAGATIMGDGRVALIIDAFGFYNMVDKSTSKLGSDMDGTESQNKIKTGEFREILLCELSDKRIYGLPLELVNRLEEFSVGEIEWSGERPLIRYREIAMPLLNLEKMLELDCRDFVLDGKNNSGKVLHTVVFRVESQYFGVVVKKIIDIATTYNKIESENIDRNGFLGTLYIDGKLITIIDVLELIDSFRLRSVRNNILEHERILENIL